MACVLTSAGRVPHRDTPTSTRAFAAGEDVLSTLRERVLLSSVLIRDAALDTGTGVTSHRDQLRQVHEDVARALEHYLPYVDSPLERDHWSRLRTELDIKLFVDTDPDIRLMRRIRRDLEERGRTFQSVSDQYYPTVRPMHIEHVEPTRRWADLIIAEGGDNDVALDVLLGQLWRIVSD